MLKSLHLRRTKNCLVMEERLKDKKLEGLVGVMCMRREIVCQKSVGLAVPAMEGG
jgi:hypothetical protein